MSWCSQSITHPLDPHSSCLLTPFFSLRPILPPRTLSHAPPGATQCQKTDTLPPLLLPAYDPPPHPQDHNRNRILSFVAVLSSLSAAEAARNNLQGVIVGQKNVAFCPGRGRGRLIRWTRPTSSSSLSRRVPAKTCKRVGGGYPPCCS